MKMIRLKLKQYLYYLLKKQSATVMQYSLFAKKLDKEADKMRKLIYTLKCFQEFLFGDANYKINKRRQISLQKLKNSLKKRI